jgi:hypothetical protein
MTASYSPQNRAERLIATGRVGLALLTVARIPPKYTTLFDATALKLVPLIVTDVPTAPDAGVNDVMDGTVVDDVQPPR